MSGVQGGAGRSPHKWRANFPGWVGFGFPRRVSREGAGLWATLPGSHSDGGTRGASLALVCELNCLVSLPGKGKRKYLPPSGQVDKPVDSILFVSLSKADLGSLPKAQGWGSVFAAPQKTAWTFCTLIRYLFRSAAKSAAF